MKKIFLSFLLATLPMIGLAQTYPSPTYNNLTVLGTFTASGQISLTSLAAQAANTVVANVAASSASPTAVAIPSCSTSTSALQYTSGTGFSCGTGFALLSGATFTGAVKVSYASPSFTLNASTGSSSNSVVFSLNNVVQWDINDAISSSSVFAIDRYTSGTYTDTPLQISNSTGAVTMSDGITGTPISGSTGSFTTLAASSTVSGAGFSSYLASPPAIGGTSAAAGSFTTIAASSTITPSQTAGIVGTTTNNNANAGSVGEYQSNTTTGTSLTTATNTNATSITLTAGDWDVQAVNSYTPGTGATVTLLTATVTTTSAGASVFPQTSAQAGVSISSGAGAVGIASPVVRMSFSSSTTVYATGIATFSGGTCTLSGFIRARRVR